MQVVVDGLTREVARHGTVKGLAEQRGSITGGGQVLISVGLDELDANELTHTSRTGGVKQDVGSTGIHLAQALGVHVVDPHGAEAGDSDALVIVAPDVPVGDGERLVKVSSGGGVGLGQLDLGGEPSGRKGRANEKGSTSDSAAEAGDTAPSEPTRASEATTIVACRREGIRNLIAAS